MKLAFLEKLPTYKLASIAASLLTPFVNTTRIPRPFLLTLVVTRQCNSRCKMCSIWKDDSSSLSLQQIRDIFEGNDFSFVRQLTLTGGEPTLRSDLSSVLEVVRAACPSLEHVELAVNGLNTQRTLEQVRRILDLLERAPGDIRRFVVQVSVDGIGHTHDEIRGVRGAYERVCDTLGGLSDLKKDHPVLQTRLSSVVMPQNVSQVDSLIAFARAHDAQVFFSPAVISESYYCNLEGSEDLTFVLGKEDGRSAAGAFEALAERENGSISLYYKDVAGMLWGNDRGRPCMMGFYGCIIEHNGDVYPCVNYEVSPFGNLLEDDFDQIWFGPHAKSVRQNLRSEGCPTCASSCYTSPVNAGELIRLAMRRVARAVSPGKRRP